MITQSENKMQSLEATKKCRIHPAFSIVAGDLICVACGMPSPSQKWREANYLPSERIEMEDAEIEVAAMSKAEKLAFLAPLLDPKNSDYLKLKHGVLSYKQHLIVTELSIHHPSERPEYATDNETLRAQAPEPLRTKRTAAQQRYDQALAEQHEQREKLEKIKAARQKLGDELSAQQFTTRDLSNHQVAKFHDLQSQERQLPFAITEALLTIDHAHVELTRADSAIDRWITVERGRREHALGAC